MAIIRMFTAAVLFAVLSTPSLAGEDNEDIHQLLDTYARSVNEFNTQPELAAQIWDTGADTVFIHPKGTEYGWKQIHNNFYTNTMGNVFSKRDLSINDDVTIDIHGETAIVTFTWLFKATQAKGGKQIENHGRETQVLVNHLGHWKIKHVHYSAMPPV